MSQQYGYKEKIKNTHAFKKEKCKKFQCKIRKWINKEKDQKSMIKEWNEM